MGLSILNVNDGFVYFFLLFLDVNKPYQGNENLGERRHRGTSEYSDITWLDGGNNDMVRGIRFTEGKEKPRSWGGRAWVCELGGKFVDTYTYCEACATDLVSKQE
jgi:hypothetical protein